MRGGVTGRPEFSPPYWYFAFFSEGLRILKRKKEFSFYELGNILHVKKAFYVTIK